jgi:hypothetical protein
MSKSDLTFHVLQRVVKERARQEMLCRNGKFSMTCADPNLPNGGKMMVLAEEFGEVAKAAWELYDIQPGQDEVAKTIALKTELIQLAAVAVAWAESIIQDEEDFTLPTPTGSNHSAQGCGPTATLGNSTPTTSNPVGVASTLNPQPSTLNSPQ